MRWVSISGLCGLALLCAQTPSQAATGRTPGTFAVSPTGAATYSIPIWSPPGPHGLQPHIALTYNSQSGNGPEGIGWSLSGLSSIYRCNSTYAQDSAAAAVALAYTDRFCLDGSRLRLTSSETLSTYGQSGTTYQTEIANFSNVTAEGTTGNGPSYFTVQGRDGLTYEYGNGTASNYSQVLLGSTANAWLLDKVTDRAGNTMTITYAKPNANLVGTTVPVTISWTPVSHGSSSYSYTMTFNYENNVPQSSTYQYVAGAPVQNSSLLQSIQIAYAGAVVKNYVLTYKASATTGREELYQIQECADAGGTNCLLPTTISYQPGAAGVGSVTTLTTPSAAASSKSAAYDFNGDGINDLIYYDNGAYYVAFGGTGYHAPISTGITTTGAVFGRVDGSDTDSILLDVGGTWYYYKWNGASFVSTSTGAPADTAASGGVIAAFADVNADGLADLVQLGSDGTIHVRLNTTKNSVVSFSSTDQATAAYPTGSYALYSAFGGHRLDFTGDGQDDLIVESEICLAYLSPTKHVCIELQYSYLVLHYAASTFPQTLVYTYDSGQGPTPGPIVDVADYNDDGCLDILSATYLYLAQCNGSYIPPIAISGGTAIGSLDWNGDGRADVLVGQSNGYIGVLLSNGTGLSSSLINTSIPYSVNNQYFVVPNSTGDGQDGLAVLSNVSPYTISYYTHSSNGAPPDLVSNITDGYGNSVSPTYVSIAQNDYTEYTDAVYPEQNYIGPLYVANMATYSDPSTSAGTFNANYSYYGAWKNLQGRGFDAFDVVRALDSRTGLYDYSYFQRSFPATGILNRHDRLQPDNATEIVQTLNGVISTTLDATANNQRYFPYVSTSSTSYWEVAGSTENGDKVSTVSSTFQYDSYGNATSIATTLTDTDPSSPYNGDSWTVTTTNTPDVDTSTWCLPLFTQTQTVYTATVGASVTRTKSFPTPDLTNCRYTQVVTEPSSTLYKVTEGYGYDSYGNVNSHSVTGIGMAARTTSINWGTTTGQFPLSVTDPSGAQTQFGYNYNYGLISSLTDPNGLITSWQYTDGFGRKTLETRPDGTYTTWTYNDCSAWGGCLFGSNALAVAQNVYNSDHSIQADGSTYFDQADRLVMSNAMMLGGTTYTRKERRYDSLGRIAQQAAPCTWTSVSAACPYWTTYSYDLLNRVTQMQRPIGASNSTLQTTTYQHAGRTTTVADANSYATTTVSDVNGWLRKTTDAVGYAVTLAYDAAGSKTGVTDSESHTLWTGTYQYGIAPFNVTASDPDLGAWSYTFDALGERTGWKDAKTKSFSETYDALSRPLTRSEPDLFTQWTWGSTPANHNVGKLTASCTGPGTNPTACTSAGLAESDTYDSLARLYQRTFTITGDPALSYTYQYGATNGLLSTLTYPVTTSGYALQLQYAYSAGYLQTVTDVSDSPNVTLWTANTMNPDGTISQETLLTAPPNSTSIVTNRSYDAVTHWLGSVTAGVSGGTGLENQSYLYGLTGTVTQRQNNTLGLTENFYYDHDYRLTSSKLGGVQNLSIGYDSNGNITSRSDVASGATWTYDPTHYHEVTQAGSSAYTYTYDANGNAATRNGSTISWTSYNYPSSITAVEASGTETVSFLYGPDRQRWQQNYNNGTEVTIYIGGLLEQVASGGITNWRHYVYAGKEPVAVYSRTSTLVNTWSYFYTDHLGSIAGIANSSGVSDVGESFTAYGARRNPTTWSGAPTTTDLNTIAGLSRQGYTFETALGQSMGLNHLNGRVEDAITGRFLSADPNIPNAGKAQDYNRFSYVDNNPLSATDPTGFDGKGCPSGASESCNEGGSSQPLAANDDNDETVTVSPHTRDGGPQPEIVPGNAPFPGTLPPPDPDQSPGMADPLDQVNVTGIYQGLPPGWAEPLNDVTVTGIQTGQGGGSGSGKAKAQSQTGCHTVLPNGNTVGQYVNQGRAQLQSVIDTQNDLVQGGGDINPLSVDLTFASIVRDYGQIDFKNGAAGPGGNGATLGQAGNFAYYAIGSGYLSKFELDAGASLYALASVLRGNKPLSSLSSSPSGPPIDASAASTRSAGLAASGCP